MAEERAGMFSRERTLTGARELQTRGSGLRGYYLSTPKLPGLTQVESSLEADAVYVATIDPRVASIVPQPCSYELNTGARFETRDELEAWAKSKGFKPSIYTPDFRVRLSTGSSYILETRHTQFLDKGREKLLVAQKLLHSLGIQFVLATEEEITRPMGQNARTLVGIKDRDVATDLARIMHQRPEVPALAL
jgi:hypothetical protein